MQWFNNLKMHWKFNFLTLLTVAGFLFSGIYFYNTLSTVKVNGPLYKEIVYGKDLMADILPPPEYIIESQLTVHQMIYHTGSEEIQRHIKKLQQLKEEYETRHQYWEERLVEGEMKKALLQDSYKPAMQFFAIVENEFIPAIENGKKEEAKSLLNGKLNDLYREHRLAIDRIAKMSAEWCVQNEQNAAAEVESGTVLVVVIIAVALGVIIAFSLFVSRIINRSMHNLTTRAESIANGDLTVEIRQLTNDEIGLLAGTFKKMVESLRHTIGGVQEATSTVASAATQISSNTEQMAAGAQEQTSQAGEVASAVEEMTKTIIENSKNASDTASTANHAREAAQQGGAVVKETVEGMKRIAEVVNKSAETVKALGKSSDQIGKIISVINDIADQTNLLALNAAIEAARAGEQGRGFAVVADEVRKLAERTTKATKEIAAMIQQIQTDTKHAVASMEEGTKEVDEGIQLADKAGESLKEIVAISQEVTDKVTQIAAASEQQSSASEQISKNVEAISTVTQQSASGIQQIAHTAEDLNRLTENLQQLVEKFKLGETQTALKSMPKKTTEKFVFKTKKDFAKNEQLMEQY